ncbi:uncharacterized protein LOC110628149 isoform X2 [Manihot esculenta]|uniref:Uncharacterized protein n=1 Tax=Manihot esculenta TaxID=3983 RepID=A0ACB7GSW3_MANES|nr:uncharacterized protein LOC110628149 isoform X2 [Manihot esculenta]KAG8643014.1 hypothetical protein MANES_12G157300v8 [Manihot esculenta]
MGFEAFEPIYGEPKVEWAKTSDSDSVPLRRFLMQIFAPDYYNLKIQVTDYHSNTFASVKSIMQLEDMRDSIGIGGSWSDFVDYFVASVKSEDVKLVLEKHSHAYDPMHAKLIAQKSKGMPLISISLAKLVDSAANGAMENMSFELFKAFKLLQNLVLQEQGCTSQLTKVTAIEKDDSGTIHSQLEKRQKLQKTNSSDKTGAFAPSNNGSSNSPDKQSARDPVSKKVANRVVPAYRRAKVRGALLQDTEDDKDN